MSHFRSKALLDSAEGKALSEDLRDILFNDLIADTDTAPMVVPQRFSLVWDGRAPKLKDWPEQPVRLWSKPSESSHATLWLGLAFNPLPSAGFTANTSPSYVQSRLPSTSAHSVATEVRKCELFGANVWPLQKRCTVSDPDVPTSTTPNASPVRLQPGSTPASSAAISRGDDVTQ